MSDQYAVMGHPIAHSKSPHIHSLFAQQTEQDIDYQAQLVPLEGFDAALQTFIASNGHGLNITVPFKQQAFEAVDSLSSSAQLAGAINTITIQHGKTYGDNTDGPGLVRDLTHNHQLELRQRKILVLGAGGAVRGVLQPLLAEHPQCLHIANRTVARAETLVDIFSATAGDSLLSAGAYSELGEQTFDLIINGTAAGLSGELPAIPDNILTPGGTSYDMMYSDQPTAFVTWGQEQGANLALDGLGMLVEQAAESFQIWRGVRPDTTTVIKTLRP